MTAARITPARRFPSLRRAAISAGLAVGIAFTAVPAPAAAAPALTYSVAGATVTAPNWGSKIAVWTALGQRGDPYRWGGAGPSSFDCSGLTQYAWRKAGIRLPHSSRMQSTMGRAVSKSALRAGDLVFFYRPVSHVAMYIGNGRIVHAPNRGSVVHVTQLKYMPSYAGARRPY